MKVFLVRTDSSGFIKVEIDGADILMAMETDEDVKKRIEHAAIGSGSNNLHPFLVSEARQLCKSYSTVLTNPLDVFLIKSSMEKETRSDIDMDF